MSVNLRYPEAVEYHKTSKRSSGKNTQKYIVLHYTAGSSVSGAVNTLAYSDSKVSCQFVVGMNADVHQIGNLDDIQWHAGTSEWKGLKNLNAHSIGIEIDNPGMLEPRGNGRYVSWFGREYTKEQGVIEAPYRKLGPKIYGWLPYTPRQLAAVEKLVKWIIDNVPTIEEVVGHEDIAPIRKQDPAIGIIMPTEFVARLNAYITGDDGEHDGMDQDKPDPLPEKSGKFIVDVKNVLNIRLWPATTSQIIGSLKSGDIVDIERYANGWGKLSDQEGWVHAAYLKAV